MRCYDISIFLPLVIVILEVKVKVIIVRISGRQSSGRCGRGTGRSTLGPAPPPIKRVPDRRSRMRTRDAIFTCTEDGAYRCTLMPGRRHTR